MIHHERDRRQGQPIRCHICNASGGTLIKDDKGYRHHESDMKCRLMKLRR